MSAVETVVTRSEHDVAGPFFEDLHVGLRADAAPGLTLTEGHAAAHQAILGGRLRLALEAGLAREVTGAAAPLVHPQLVCDVAIGQSTLLTQRVIANLFYRGLAFRRLPVIGDTLRTSTEVVALRQTSAKPGRAATGLAALRIRTVDQQERAVLDFHRCALLPLRDPDARTGRADELDAVGAGELDAAALAGAVADWRLDAFRAAVPGGHAAELATGTVWTIGDGDVVSSAPELARLSLNVAAAHHDAASTASGRRLVYGGHTIGLAAAQATRALPNLVAILAWHGCDHLAPVFEGDTLTSRLELERIEPLPGGEASDGALVHLRSRVRARRADLAGDATDEVLDWRFAAVMA
ncbi:MAG TPA: MaoC family dehydratase [Conexibacter sp.]|nr:MaoC family dehydratase [Conexibacter sp.]